MQRWVTRRALSFRKIVFKYNLAPNSSETIDLRSRNSTPRPFCPEKGIPMDDVARALERLALYLDRLKRDVEHGDHIQALSDCAELNEISRRLWGRLSKRTTRQIGRRGPFDVTEMRSICAFDVLAPPARRPNAAPTRHAPGLSPGPAATPWPPMSPRPSLRHWGTTAGALQSRIGRSGQCSSIGHRRREMRLCGHRTRSNGVTRVPFRFIRNPKLARLANLSATVRAVTATGRSEPNLMQANARTARI